VLLAGYPRRAKIADGDVIECNAVEDGVETVGSATIHRWRWTQAATATQKPALELARLIQGLPAAAAQTFPAAWSKDGADGLMAKRSWLAMWANRIPDPNRAQLQMIFVSQLVKSDSGNGSRLDRQSRAREARGLRGSIKVRCARWPDVATVCAQLETELQPTLAEMEKP